MRYHTKEYYTLMMSLGTVDAYEPVVDREYSDEEIEELYQQALDKYIEEERADYDEPPELLIYEDDENDEDDEEYEACEDDEEEDEDEVIDIEFILDEYVNREPFDENEAAEEFEEMYNDNLEEPDEDLPEWVREQVDPRILAMYFIPEKIYRKLAEQDEINEERFDELDERADEALEKLREELPKNYRRFMDILEELEDMPVIDARTNGDKLELTILGWDDEGDEEEFVLRFTGVELIEDEGVQINTWEDEDEDTDSDCELLYSELYMTDGRPEIHMLFDNNGLKYLTFTCASAVAIDGSGKETVIR